MDDSSLAHECTRCHRIGTRGFRRKRNTLTREYYYFCQAEKACSKRRFRYLKSIFPDYGTTPGFP